MRSQRESFQHLTLILTLTLLKCEQQCVFVTKTKRYSCGAPNVISTQNENEVDHFRFSTYSFNFYSDSQSSDSQCSTVFCMKHNYMFMYSKQWTTYTEQERTLNVFHLRCLRRVLGIYWQVKVTNNEVLVRADIRSVYTLLRQRRLR